jgi:hypothetical protein
MNDDALAAVMAAAHLVIARRRRGSAAPAEAAPRWALAARLPLSGVQAARFAAGGRPRWATAGRLRG